MRTTTATNSTQAFQSDFLLSIKRAIISSSVYAFAFSGFQRMSSQTSRFSQGNMSNFMKNKNYLLLIVGLFFIGIVVFMIGSFFTADRAKTSNAQGQQVNVKEATASQPINASYTFKLKDENGKDTKIKFLVENAELRDEIIVKGHQATAVSGRTFLIVNLRITNDANAQVAMQAKDYVRLTVNNAADKLAADINNDPVQIQAISTKPTRLGFPINTTDKDLTLQVGEIAGKKNIIHLNLSQK